MLNDFEVQKQLVQLQTVVSALNPAVNMKPVVSNVANWTIEEKKEVIAKLDAAAAVAFGTQTALVNYSDTCNHTFGEAEGKIKDLEGKQKDTENIIHELNQQIEVLKNSVSKDMLLETKTEISKETSILKSDIATIQKNLIACNKKTEEIVQEMHKINNPDPEDLDALLAAPIKPGVEGRISSLERSIRVAGERLRGLAEARASHVTKAAFDILRDGIIFD